MKRLLIFITLLLYGIITVSQVTSNNYLNLNKPERLDWFKKQGFGMFIHFSFDSQLGVVISHSMAGASSDYLDRFVNDLPKTFNPENFAPEEIATIAKLAGMKYIVFTTKHHSGFCMWNTQTTGFNIMNTPYGKDLLAEYVDATRKAGLAVGFYYSPEDFNFLYENGLQVRRRFTVPIPGNIMDKYLELVELQCIELMARFGKIDIIFFDGGEGLLQEKCKEVVWNMQPDIVVTRGAMQTPEQTILGITSEEPWESCITMGTQWAYKPTNEKYKTGTKLIEILIETRAKGGNLLLNTGPKPDGELPEEQEALLREMAAWNFINYEAVEDIKPWILPNEDDIWFTWRPEKKTLYAFLTNIPEWTRGERKEFVIKSAKITEDATVDVLGQSSELVEYQPSADAKTYFEQTGNGLKISCVRAQRIYNNHRWHNPLVIKITGVSPALDTPVVKTNNAEITGRAYNELMFNGEVIKTGDAEILIAGFQFRIFTGAIEELSSSKWEETNTTEISGTGEFSVRTNLLKNNNEYQYRAFVKHPKMTVYGDILRVKF